MKFTASMPGLTLFPGLGGTADWSHDVTTADLVTMAQKADELGFDALSVPWHLAMRFDEWAANMGARWPHSLTASGFLLGATKQIKLQTLVVVPCEQPIELAKAFATLDWMSGGRLIPVLLTGYMDWEFELLGVPVERRDAITDEYTEAMIELWTAELPRFTGEFVRFDQIVFEPKPVQNPLPLWFGGRATSKKALRRIARFGSGWMSYASTHHDHAGALAYIRDQPEYRADPRPLEVSSYMVEPTHDVYTHEEKAPPLGVVGVDAILERLELLAGMGVTWVHGPLGAEADAHGKAKEITSLGSYLDYLEWFAAEVMPAGRKV